MKVLLIAASLLACGLAPVATRAGAPSCPGEGRVQRTAYHPDAGQTTPPCCRQEAGCARYLSTRSLVGGGRERRT